MKRIKPILISLVILTAIIITGCVDDAESDDRVSGKYPGADTPADSARLFSPGFINTGMITRDVAIMPEMDELYFCVSTLGYRYASIMYTKKVDGYWTKPALAPHMEDLLYINFEPCISPDGKKFFFLSSRPDPANNKVGGNQDIWVMERKGDTWNEPYNLGEPVSTSAQEYYPSVTREGTLYFTRQEEDANYIYRSKYINGTYQKPEKLPPQVNCGQNRFNAFISPDEDYIIVPAAGMEGSTGGSTDYYIVFRDNNDNWSEPVNMGEKINSKSNLEFSAYVSPDKEALFFMSARLFNPDSIYSLIPDGNIMDLYNMPETGNSNIYWIKSDIIEDLKQKAVFTNKE